MNQELADYVDLHRQQGFSDESIRQELLAAGWTAEDITSAFGINQSSQNQTSLLPTRDLFKSSAEVYVRNFKDLILINLLGLATVILSVAGGVGTIKTFQGFSALLFDAAYLLALILSLLSYLSLVTYLLAEQPITVPEAIKRGIRKFWAYVWTGIASGLVLGGASILIVLALLGVAGIFIIFHFAINSLLFKIVLGLLFIPYFILLLQVILAPLISVTEPISGFSAIAKSRSYMKGRAWKVFVRTIIPIIVYVILVLISSAGLIFSSTLQIGLMHAMFWLISPWLVAYTVKLYRNLASTWDATKKVSRGWFIGLASITLIVLVTLIASAGFIFEYLRQHNIPLSSLGTASSSYQGELAPTYSPIATSSPTPTPLPHYSIDPAVLKNIPNGTVLGNYIIQNLNNGVSADAIRAALIKGSWQASYVDQALNAVHQSP